MESGDGIAAVIVPRARDLGDGFEVRRALPAAERRSVGPFVFLDQMGPARFAAGQGLDVRPHPHIGLATLTYLFEGEILHRDSLGTVQPIRPGEVNWMVAGRGIAHSERSPEAARGGSLFGLQSWIALPKAAEDCAPFFEHHGEAALPLIERDGARLRLVAGTFRGHEAPVRVFSPMVYVDAVLDAGARFAIPPEHEERAVYVAAGAVTRGSARHEAGRLLVLAPGAAFELAAAEPARAVLVGGAPLDGPRRLWWNFVASSSARIEAAKAEWQARRFAPVPGETEFIPLPDGPPVQPL